MCRHSLAGSPYEQQLCVHTGHSIDSLPACALSRVQSSSRSGWPHARAAGGTGMSGGSEGSVMPSQRTIKTQNKIRSLYGVWGFILCPHPHPPTPFTPVKVVGTDISLWHSAEGDSISLDTILIITCLQNHAISLALHLVKYSVLISDGRLAILSEGFRHLPHLPPCPSRDSSSN